MKNKNHPSETLPIDNSCQTGLPLLSEGVFIMKEIKLTQGKVALVDDEDFESLNQHKWCAVKNGSIFYAVRASIIGGKRRNLWMHCEILNKKGIDHIDHNGLNNQKSNLRFCTQSENLMNQRKLQNCTSIYKGVSFYKRHNKWKAYITINGKRISLGYFISEIEAAKVYNAKATEIFGGYANLNELN